jgi:hypothetical protein
MCRVSMGLSSTWNRILMRIETWERNHISGINSAHGGNNGDSKASYAVWLKAGYLISIFRLLLGYADIWYNRLTRRSRSFNYNGTRAEGPGCFEFPALAFPAKRNWARNFWCILKCSADHPARAMIAMNFDDIIRIVWHVGGGFRQ